MCPFVCVQVPYSSVCTSFFVCLYFVSLYVVSMFLCILCIFTVLRQEWTN